MTDPPTPRRAALAWIVALTSTAYFMVVLDSSVLITALPRMQRDLGVGLASLQWTLNAYGIAFAAGIITAAALVLPLSLTSLTTAFPAEKRG
jgi:MFS family permease